MWGVAISSTIPRGLCRLGLASLAPGQSPNTVQHATASVHEGTPQSTSIPSKQDDLSLNWNDFDHRVWVTRRLTLTFQWRTYRHGTGTEGTDAG